MQRENWELKKQQEKDSWNPDSICVIVITPVFRTRVPLWTRPRGCVRPLLSASRVADGGFLASHVEGSEVHAGEAGLG